VQPVSTDGCSFMLPVEALHSNHEWIISPARSAALMPRGLPGALAMTCPKWLQPKAASMHASLAFPGSSSPGSGVAGGRVRARRGGSRGRAGSTRSTNVLPSTQVHSHAAYRSALLDTVGMHSCLCSGTSRTGVRVQECTLYLYASSLTTCSCLVPYPVPAGTLVARSTRTCHCPKLWACPFLARSRSRARTKDRQLKID